MTIKRTERGWSGHFIAADYCQFKRNTLLEKGERKIIVSTIGAYFSPTEQKIVTIGFARFYETMVFEAILDDGYWDIDISNKIKFKSNWEIGEMERMSDQKANDMHEAVVEEMTIKLKKGELNVK